MKISDVKTWTDEELCAEMAAVPFGNQRLSLDQQYLVQQEYERRCGIKKPAETELFNRYLSCLQSHQEPA